MDSKLLSEVHRFTPLDWSTQVPPEGVRESGLEGLFELRLSEVPSELRGIVSRRGQAEYYSPSPQHALQQQEDIVMLQHCALKKNWAIVAQSVGICQLLCNPHLAIRSTRSSLKTWFLSLGSVGGSVLTVWPLMETMNPRTQNNMKPNGPHSNSHH
eukprot:4912909-Amphidinium_carterae.1